MRTAEGPRRPRLRRRVRRGLLRRWRRVAVRRRLCRPDRGRERRGARLGVRRAVPVGRRVRARGPGAEDRRQADDRRGQPRLSAVLRAVRHATPIRGSSATRPTARASRAPSRFAIADEMGFAKDARHLDLTPLQQRDRAGSQGLRHVHHAGLVQPRASPGDRLSRRLLRPHPVAGRGRQEQVREGGDDRRPQGHAARRAGRDDQPQDDHRRRRPVQGAEGLRLQRRCGRSPPERADRRAGGRPADRVLRVRRAAGRWDHRRPVRGLRGRRALRRGAGQGQPPDRVRERRDRPAGRGRDPRRARHASGCPTW